MATMSTRPVIDYRRCEGKGACVQVCPCDVFEIRVLTAAEVGPLGGPLGLGGRLKRLLHGGRQAVAVRAADCRACGKCVAECPEEAIRLERTVE
jgi:NAD-dependent dihydropyrimidine dehydrogenase PreA subunit